MFARSVPVYTLRTGKLKEASKWVMNVGATLHKMGGASLPLAERTFQHSVFLAKQLDTNVPEYMHALLEGNNTELGDAYTWLGATESAMQKLAEAETHYKAVETSQILSATSFNAFWTLCFLS